MGLGMISVTLMLRELQLVEKYVLENVQCQIICSLSSNKATGSVTFFNIFKLLYQIWNQFVHLASCLDVDYLQLIIKIQSFLSPRYHDWVDRWDFLALDRLIFPLSLWDLSWLHTLVLQGKNQKQLSLYVQNFNGLGIVVDIYIGLFNGHLLRYVLGIIFFGNVGLIKESK